MNVFFGKISASDEHGLLDKQMSEKRYYAKEGSSWFGDIQPGDYCYILSGDKVYLWKAKEYTDEYLQFESVIKNELPIDSNQFKSFKYFKFNPEIIVLTTRMSKKKSFFKIQVTNDFNETLLTDLKTYTNAENFRKIYVVDEVKNDNGVDIYLIRKDSGYELHKSSFFDDNTFNKFIDNTKMFGKSKKDRSNKDNTISKISKASINSELNDVSMLSFYDLFFSTYKTNEFNKMDDVESNIESDQDDLTIKNPLNQILYGPPGTGKTYHTIDKAIEIIENRKVLDTEDREKLKKQFEIYRVDGQIEFVTFHQSYGYEEFVEGIKADTNEKDEIIYIKEPGIFKKLSDKAKDNIKNSKVQDVIKKSFEEVFQGVILDKLTVDGLKIFTARKYFTITDITERTIFFEKADGQTNHSLSIKTLKEMYEKEINTRIKGGLSVYYDPILNLLLKNAQAEVSEVEPLKNYILIIDEINRGNISKIFGELITLIEDSKRLGCREEVEITLPYTGKKFGVPSNLYILGTMNTADRSIALMDTALRRRFEFEEMMPDLAVLSNNTQKIVDFNSNEPQVNDLTVDEINIRLLLKKINQRIEYLYDRDHTIGHAYFMSLKDKVKEASGTLREKTEEEKLTELGNIFKNKIIPLLQEYFYDDWEKIQIVLGDHPEQFKKKGVKQNFHQYQFIQSKEIKEDDILGFDHPDIENDSIEYTINSEFRKVTYIKIYGAYPSVKMNENEEKTTNVA